MKSIKEIVKTPSAALQYMVDGLLNQSKRPDFKITMSTFGDYSEGICYGCAATCALQEIAGKNFNDCEIDYFKGRAHEMGFNSRELNIFEDCIDHARRGWLSKLFRFLDLHYTGDYDYRFLILDDTWHSEIPKVNELIAELKSKGL